MTNVKHIMEDSGIRISHEEQALPIIRKLLKEFVPELIIELGTSKGGLTYVLHSAVKTAELHTYDIKHKSAHKDIANKFGENVFFHIADIQTKPLEEIIDLCKDKRKKLLYCDNGNKIKEVKMYSPNLLPGDILGMHDWGKEIRYTDVREELSVFHPHPINEELEENNCMSRFWIRRDDI
jgi:cephalosporin hydroxylase